MPTTNHSCWVGFHLGLGGRGCKSYPTAYTPGMNESIVWARKQEQKKKDDISTMIIKRLHYMQFTNDSLIIETWWGEGEEWKKVEEGQLVTPFDQTMFQSQTAVLLADVLSIHSIDPSLPFWEELYSLGPAARLPVRPYETSPQQIGRDLTT